MPRQKESRSFSPWTSTTLPERVLVIRFHALGDVAIILPASALFRERFPGPDVDFLTMGPAADLAGRVTLFREIIPLPVPSSRWTRAILAVRTGFRMRRKRYDVVIDLQRNWMSRIIRRLAGPRSWGEFDRFSPLPASKRTRQTFADAGFPIVGEFPTISCTPADMETGRAVLQRNGWREDNPLIIINPAGLWSSRNWPMENYVQLCRHLLEADRVQFLLLGTERMRVRASVLSAALGSSAIDLTGTTTTGEAFAILSNADLMVTEDSGLMHMGWAAHVPILALFGSSRHDWSAPEGENVVCLHSGDLPCGACMEATCRYGDVHCLTRYTPERVFREAHMLLKRTHTIRD